ncbi:MAG: hypothetical protein WC712_01595 [Candidatus Brocadiia bacterium]
MTDKAATDAAFKFFESFTSAMKSGDIDRIMSHYVDSEQTVQILSNGHIIFGFNQIKQEYALFLDAVEMIDFQVPQFQTVEMCDRMMLVVQLNGMVRVRKSRVKLPYRGTGAILLNGKGPDFKMVYEHFTLID